MHLRVLIINIMSICFTLFANGQQASNQLLIEYTKANKLDSITALVNSGADLNISDASGKTPLHYAVIESNIEIVNLLIENNANVNLTDNKNASPIVYAIFNQNTPITKQLLTKNNEFPQNFIHKDSLFFRLVAKSNKLYFIKLAFLLNPNLEYIGKAGLTAVTVAKKQGKDEISAFFNNPDILKIYFDSDQTNKAFEYLKEKPEQLSILDEQNNSLLHRAVNNNNPTLVQNIIELDTENSLLELKNNKGETALYRAVLLDNKDVGKLLVNKKANHKAANNMGVTPYSIAQNRQDSAWLRPFLTNTEYENLNPKLRPILQIAGHTGGINSIDISKDGRLMLSGSDDNAMILWDLKEKKVLRVFIDHDAKIMQVRFSPDNHYGLSCSKDKKIKLWDIYTGDLIRTLNGHSRRINSIEFSKSGKKIISCADDNTIKIWDLKSGNVVLNIKNPDANLNCVTFSSDEEYIIAGTANSYIHIWSIKDRKLISSIKTNGNPTSIQTRANNDTVFFSDSLSINSFSINNPPKKAKLNKAFVTDTSIYSNKTFKSFSISKNNKWLVSSYASYILVHNLKTPGKQQYFFKAHKKNINTVKFVPNQNIFVSGSKNGFIKIWKNTFDQSNPEILNTNKNLICESIELNNTDNNFRILDIDFSPDGHNAFLSGGNQTKARVIIFDKTRYSYFAGNTDVFWSSDYFPESDLLITGGGGFLANKGGAMDLWDMKTQTKIKSFQNQKNKVVSKVKFLREQKYTIMSVQFSNDGDRILSGATNGYINLWNTNTGMLIKSKHAHSKTIKTVKFTPDNEHIISASFDGLIKVWNAKRLSIEDSLKGHTKALTSIDFSPDGKILASGSMDRTLKFWDIESAKCLHTSTGHTSPVYFIDYSPDGKSVLSGSKKGEIKSWNPKNGFCTKSYNGHTREVSCLKFFPNSRYFLSASLDNSLKIWEVGTETEMATITFIDSSNWVITTPSGLFDASSESAFSALYFVQGMETINVEQLKDLYYEPNLLRKILGYNHEPIRQVIDINNIKPFPVVKALPITDGRLKLKIADKGGGIGKIKVYINGKEIADDARTLSLESSEEIIFRGQKAVDTTEYTIDISNSLFLLPGEKNTITIRAYNEDNYLKSNPVEVFYTPKSDKDISRPNFYALVIGVSDYRGEEMDLRYASKDAASFSKALKLATTKLFGEEHVHIKLLNTDNNENFPNKQNIDKAFKEVEKNASVNDIFMVYLAGHGTNHGGLEGDFYYMTADAANFNLSLPDLRKQIAISSDEITEYFKKVASLKQILIMDACHSGKYADDLMESREDVSSSVIRSYERMKDRTGMYILAGSAADAVSYETSLYGQGLLTYSLIFGMKGAALRDGQFIDVAQLFQFAADYVPIIAEGIGGIQRPQVRSPMGGQSFDIGHITNAEKEQIVLAEPKPLFIRSMFTPENNYKDILGLSSRVDNALRNNSSSKEGNLVFIDATDYPKAYSLAGRYKKNKKGFQISVELYQGNEVIDKYSCTGSNEKDAANEIIKLGLSQVNQIDNK